VSKLYQSADDREIFSIPNGASGVDGELARVTPLRPVAHPLPTTPSCQPMFIEVQRLKAIALALCRLKPPARLSQAPPDGLNHFIFSPR